MSDLTKYDDQTVLQADQILHFLKKRYSAPPGNALFRLLMAVSRPVCDEVSDRSLHPSPKAMKAMRGDA